MDDTTEHDGLVEQFSELRLHIGKQLAVLETKQDAILEQLKRTNDALLKHAEEIQARAVVCGERHAGDEGRNQMLSEHEEQFQQNRGARAATYAIMAAVSSIAGAVASWLVALSGWGKR